MKSKLNRRQFVGQVAHGALAAGAGAALASSPARAAEKTRKWKMVTTWPKNFPGLGTGAERLAKSIESMSGGRISVRVYGAGELVPAMGVFDAVSRGTAEMGHGAPYYWKGKHEATQFFAAIPWGLMAHEMAGWIAYGGGQKLWDEVYAPFNLKPFGVGNTLVQMGGWYSKPIQSAADYKGLKMRMPGLGGEVLRRLGATVVNIPGGEIFQALKTGAIDATEWVGPYNDLAFGLHQAAKLYYWPGWHEPGTLLECMVNKTAFDALPKDLQSIVQFACEAAHSDMIAEFAMRNAGAFETLKTKHKVQVKQFPEDVLKKTAEISREVVGEVAAKDPLSKKAYESQLAFLKLSTRYNRISEEGYSVMRGKVLGL